MRCLTLHFSKHLRRCERATAGPNLTDDAVAEIAARVQDEILVTTGTRYGTVVLFSLEHVQGTDTCLPRWSLSESSAARAMRCGTKIVTVCAPD
jgi:hypothetical protein